MSDERWYDEGASPETEWERFAQSLVQKLIDGDANAAYSMLSESLKAELRPEEFEQHFNNLVSVEDVPLGPASVIMSLDDYPDMTKSEVGNAYVHVGGDNNEAMSIFVQAEVLGGFSVLRIEWGRP